MLRTFAEHVVRFVESLKGRWEFAVESERKDKGKFPAKYPRTIHVPSAWEKLPGLENYRGRAWYRTRIPAVKDRAVRLVFGGVSHTGTVYVDGKRQGGHYDAFTPWDVVVPNLKEGDHALMVEVDNSFGDHSALHKENDYFTYGGITRPVEIQFVPEVYIDRLFVVPVRRGKRWNLDVRVRLKNWGRKKLLRNVVVGVAGERLDLGRVTVSAEGSCEVKGSFAGLNVKPWNAGTPDLYNVVVQLLDGATLVDDLIDRVGFREVKVKGRQILLNGKSIRLRGYCRHEDHPQFGCALPVEAMVTDLEILRDLGCNFIRGVHYPYDMRFLDLCDEMGIYLWEESHARNVDVRHPKFREQIKAVTEEMVDWHFNRPCILMWGCLNECDSVSAYGRRQYERVLKILKEGDGARPVTYAENSASRSLCMDLVDIVAWNRYDAWYRADGTQEVEPALKEMLAWLHSPKSRGGKNKPVIMSEFGGGALYGYRTPSRVKWSEEYQADVLDESLRVYLNHPDVVGASIWQFCDVRVTRNHWSTRPRTMNNKGTVDEYRRPKLSYEVVKKRMHEAARRWKK